MKITLISTDSDRWGFGIRLLSAVLRSAGHSARLIFLASEADTYLRDVLQETSQLAASSDFIGLSCFSRGSHKARQVALHLRRLGKPIVWGGLHATLNPQECATVAGIVCRGEGEETIVELAETLGSGKDWRTLRNLAYVEQDQVILNPLRPPFRHLDDLPVFDFERQDEFQLTDAGVTEATRQPKREQAIAIGSRGCAFRCTYCCNSQLRHLYSGNGQYIRKLSPRRYVDHLETLYKKHFPNATDFFLVDEDFFLRSVEEITEFASLYKQRVGIPFECMASPPRVTEEKLRLLADSGLWRIRLGIESGSERTKTVVYKRVISNEAVQHASEVIGRQSGVVPAYFFIIGNPYEEEADLIATLRLMAKLSNPYYVQVFNLVFFPGSELFNRAVADGMIAGAQDSGWELHYRSGFKYQEHAWKQKNLYLNALIFLTEGKTTKYRMGMLPRCVLGILILPQVIGFAERRPAISHLLVLIKTCLLYVRREAGALLKSVMHDPAGVYDMRRYVKRSARSVLRRSREVLAIKVRESNG